MIEQARRAASELARGRSGTELAPPEILTQVVALEARLDACNRRLDEEGWLIGLLTLACLAEETGSANPR
jgi:hypothetical protein